jgi:hypothetical protein
MKQKKRKNSLNDKKSQKNGKNFKNHKTNHLFFVLFLLLLQKRNLERRKKIEKKIETSFLFQISASPWKPITVNPITTTTTEIKKTLLVCPDSFFFLGPII